MWRWAQVGEVRLLLEEAQNGAQAAREELRQERLASKRTAERAHTNHMRHMQAHAAELSQLQVQKIEMSPPVPFQAGVGWFAAVEVRRLPTGCCSALFASCLSSMLASSVRKG